MLPHPFFSPFARDKVARAEDESYGYVMSVYVMIRVARKCPSNRDELEGCGNPLPRLVQRHAEEVLAIVEVSSESGFPCLRREIETRVW